MGRPSVFHVRSDDGQVWTVMKQGFGRPHFTALCRETAILVAKRLAKAGAPAEVVVHNDQSTPVSTILLFPGYHDRSLEVGR